MKIKTWQDLKNFLGTLNEAQLTQQPIILKDDEHCTISEAGFNEEDIVWNDEMYEGSIPVSEYKEEDYDIPLDSDENTIYPKGSIVQVWAD